MYFLLTVVFQSIPTFGDFLCYVVVADLLMLEQMGAADWAHLQCGSLKGRRLVLPNVGNVCKHYHFVISNPVIGLTSLWCNGGRVQCCLG